MDAAEHLLKDIRIDGDWPNPLLSWRRASHHGAVEVAQTGAITTAGRVGAPIGSALASVHRKNFYSVKILLLSVLFHGGPDYN